MQKSGASRKLTPLENTPARAGLNLESGHVFLAHEDHRTQL